MNWFTSVVLFVLIWWVVIFAVLPFGTRPVDVDQEAGGWRGAPERPMLGRKIIATTVIAVLLWAGAMAVGLLAAVLSLALQGLDALALPLARLASGDAWSSGFATSYGTTVVLAALAMLTGLLSLRVGRRPLEMGLAAAALVLAGLALSLAGCAGVPPAVMWTTVGAGLGFGAKLVDLDTMILDHLWSRPTAATSRAPSSARAGAPCSRAPITRPAPTASTRPSVWSMPKAASTSG